MRERAKYTQFNAGGLGLLRRTSAGLTGMCKDSVFTCLEADNNSKITGVNAEKHHTLASIKK